MSDTGQYERNLRAAERAHDNVDGLAKLSLDASIRDAQEAIKVALLINGGAAVAILAFVSGVVGRTNISIYEMRSVAHSLFYFTTGIVFAGITAACAYLSNQLYAANFRAQEKTWEYPYVRPNKESRRSWWWAKFYNWVGFILAWASLIAFIIGVFVAARALLALKSLFF